MEYQNRIEAVFLERINRFVARVEIDGKEEKVHVPNTGRCREIFVPGTRVYLSRSEKSGRKYPYTLYEAYKGDMLIHIDSAGANRLAEEALMKGRVKELIGAAEIVREKPYGSSRFDFRFQQDGKLCYMEVKGVTLEIDGVAKFPDAPTERGARHLAELQQAASEGFGAYVLFVIQMKGVKAFTPFTERDRKFSEALSAAASHGVKVLAYDTKVTPEHIVLDQSVPVVLPQLEEEYDKN